MIFKDIYRRLTNLNRGIRGPNYSFKLQSMGNFLKPFTKLGLNKYSIVQSTAGNLPAILARMIDNAKALGAVLHAGLPRGYRGNSSASPCVVQTY